MLAWPAGPGRAPRPGLAAPSEAPGEQPPGGRGSAALNLPPGRVRRCPINTAAVQGAGRAPPPSPRRLPAPPARPRAPRPRALPAPGANPVGEPGRGRRGRPAPPRPPRPRARAARTHPRPLAAGVRKITRARGRAGGGGEGRCTGAARGRAAGPACTRWWGPRALWCRGLDPGCAVRWGWAPTPRVPAPGRPLCGAGAGRSGRSPRVPSPCWVPGPGAPFGGDAFAHPQGRETSDQLIPSG